MKKIFYIGLKAHQKTFSTKFFMDMLSKYYTLDILWIDQFNASIEVINSKKIYKEYVAVIFFQIMIRVEKLQFFKCQNIILIPMYDNDLNITYGKWKEFNNYKFINFSKSLHDKLTFLGNKNSLYVQYAPKSLPYISNTCEKKKVFFWQRAVAINWDLIKRLIKFEQVASIHFHTMKNDIKNDKYFIMPTKEEMNKYNITFSTWFEDKSEIHKKIQECDVLIAPRLYEGIGQVFLEAMSYGKCVISPNKPTMNEYIEHNVNGLLFDYKNPEKIDLLNAHVLGKNAQKTINTLHKKWCEDEEKIIYFIEKEKEKLDNVILSKNTNYLKTKLLENEIFLYDDLNMGTYNNNLSILFSKYLNVLHEEMKKFVLNNNKVIIYGAGTGAKLLISINPQIVKYIVDRNVSLINETLMNKPIYNLERLQKEKTPQIVLISVFGRSIEILQELHSIQELSHHNFVSLDIDPYYGTMYE